MEGMRGRRAYGGALCCCGFVGSLGVSLSGLSGRDVGLLGLDFLAGGFVLDAWDWSFRG